MFRYEKMPPDLTYSSHAWYVVDRDRDLWLESLGTNGPSGDRVFALCVRGRKIPFEATDEIVTDGVLENRIQTLGASYQARFAHGIQWQTFPDPDERLAMEELAAEAVLVLHAGERAKHGLPFADHRVIGNKGAVYRLADFGYPTGPSWNGDTDD